jgi:TPR repeat protein
LANFLENIRRQYTEATNLYKKTCDEMKYGPSCQTYAKQRSLGRGCKQDLAEACRYSLLCCDSYNLIEGCINSGICLTEGVGNTPIDVKRGVSYYEKACDRGHPLACLKLFKIYIDGSGNVSRNPNRAFECATRACEYGDLVIFNQVFSIMF